MEIWLNNVPGRGNSMYKSPEGGAVLTIATATLCSCDYNSPPWVIFPLGVFPILAFL